MDPRKYFAGLVVFSLVLCAIAAVIYADCGSCSKDKGKTEKAAKPQTLCPVTGEKINKDIYVDVDGYRIFLCCKGCAEKVKADPKKYIEKIRATGEEPVKCPAACEKKKESAKASCGSTCEPSAK